MSEHMVCDTCLGQLEHIRQGCQRCKQPGLQKDAISCYWCERLGFLPQQITSSFVYRNTGRELYHQVKYHGYWRLIEPLVQHSMNSFFQNIDFLSYDVFVPIPETFSRKWKRHFNPAGQIAKMLGRQTGLPFHSLLSMRPFSPHQVGLDYLERKKNAANRFHCSGSIPKSVIIVDDVITTGATLEAASLALKEAGAQRIAWYSLFRTP